jgi:hypothetical protein
VSEIVQVSPSTSVVTRSYNVETTSKTSDGKLKVERMTYEVTTYDHNGKIDTKTNMTKVDFLI